VIFDELRKFQGLELTFRRVPTNTREQHDDWGWSDSEASTMATASELPARADRAPKPYQAVLRPIESNSGSLKNVLASPAPEEAKGGANAEEEAPAGCPTEPGMYVIDRLMPSYDKLMLAFSIVVGWVAFFTYFMVDGAGRLGCIIGVPEVIMGMVVLAAGTSVPDMIASISVARDGHGDMAAANAVGSNTFDILLGLGLPWLIACMMGTEIHVPAAQIIESLVILSVCLVLYLALLHLNGWKLKKWIGFAMLAAYAGSIVFVLARYFMHYSELDEAGEAAPAH